MYLAEIFFVLKCVEFLSAKLLLPQPNRLGEIAGGAAFLLQLEPRAVGRAAWQRRRIEAAQDLGSVNMQEKIKC